MNNTLIKSFLTDDFLLQSEAAKILYHDFAKSMPIIDYHCHLPPDEIATNKQFENMTEIWLKGDHYKWRAMRTLGIDEKFITGNSTDKEKFQKWAETVPYTMRNPLYHWTHMELKTPFGVEDLLDGENAAEVYAHCNEKLSNGLTTQALLKHFNVKVVCTTDDPCDNLEHHAVINKNPFGTKVFPTFRPDAAMAIDNKETFIAYIKKLEAVENKSIENYDDFLAALKNRHDFFARMGCQVSDHGLETIYAEPYTEAEIRKIFKSVVSGQSSEASTNSKLTTLQILKFKSAMLHVFAVWDFEKNWTQQFHLGAIRNNNSRLIKQLGKDVGADSVGDFSQVTSMSRFFDRLDKEHKLPKTIIYNLNPSDNESFATMIGNFQDGKIRGKMQFGSGWWFLDQKDGMTKQINALSNMGLLSCFVGMLTDSRSFLSFPRHEYFRRLLCNIFGEDIKNGELPNDLKWIGQIVQDICYNNAKNYFNF